MQEAIEKFIEVTEHKKWDDKSPSTEIRNLAAQVAKFHIEACTGQLFHKSLAVVAALVEYADELEK